MRQVKALSTSRRREDLELFDQHPIQLPGFVFRTQRAEALGKPTILQWTNAMAFAEAAEDSSPYWVGDLALYADTRPEWAERLTALLSDMKIAKHTVENLKSISKHVAAPARHLAPSKSHAALVTRMQAPDQERWLERAKAENWTEKELRHAIRHHEKTKILDGQAAEMQTIDVTVQVDLEAPSPYAGEQQAWAWVKQAVKGLHGATVISAHARPK